MNCVYSLSAERLAQLLWARRLVDSFIEFNSLSLDEIKARLAAADARTDKVAK